MSGYGVARTPHTTRGAAFAGAVTLAEMAGKNVSHGRCASAGIAAHYLLEELNVGSLSLCVGITCVEVALVQVISSVGRDGSRSGKEGKDDGLGEKHVDGRSID